MEETPIFIPVTIIEARGETFLVEYNAGGLKRAIIPGSEVKDGQADVEILALGIPYGLPWEEMVNLQATSELLAQELRIRGIWTIDDMRRNQPVVYGALQAVYGLDLAGLINAAETYVRGR
jgi:hypothetical protein